MEQLQTSNERLLYDVQRRGRPLDDDDDDRRRSRRPSLIRLAAHAAARSPVQRIQWVRGELRSEAGAEGADPLAASFAAVWGSIRHSRVQHGAAPHMG